MLAVINRSVVSCGLLTTRITFISISLKTSNIPENKAQVFERSDCAIPVHNDIYYNKLLI